MAVRDKLRTFIDQLFEAQDLYTEHEIVDEARQADFAPDEVGLFEALPDGVYTEEGLIQALNAVAERQGRVEAMGGRG